MSYSSRSSNGRHYQNGNQGSSHYKKKGLFGNFLNMIGSGSGSQKRNNNNRNQQNYGNQQNNAHINHQPTNHQNTAVCSNCNAQIPAGSKFCLQCGQKVNQGLCCMNCGEKLPPNAKFCQKCGTKIS